MNRDKLVERITGVHNIIPIWKRYYQKECTLFDFGMELTKQDITKCANCGAYKTKTMCETCGK